MSVLTIAQAIAWATKQLHDYSESAKLDSEVLLLHVIEKNRTYLFTWPEAELSKPQQSLFETYIKRRITGEPVAHITGQREFWSLPLKVNNSTLIPRPDTETLVEHVLTLTMPNDAKVLDLGTGTGAIALALASEYPSWEVTAVDASAAAVALAKENQTQLGFDNVTILQSDWFDALAEQRFDLIVSNPPYIDEEDHHLSQGDVRFEPRSALVAAMHGYADIFHIITCAKRHLNAGGYLLLEHGFEQASKIRQFFAEMAYINILTIKDMAGCDRVTLAMLP
ncbi:peptide chain release factor N(5)-glutamine methyltransferase [Pseudoalteromonas peptidolytica]|uniref:Release factor glutamine methyltransferase n=1 Tax=Pseudoalteromonas peptidolytica F12-50-A1 TaxID=1315280 RepID=A0A8I0T5N6_9GAMM|nr:peptide chain release factor N(5)-glutamine methyltransferase [Pseudoalteromonas peptidolytica]MBE0347582.1 release factor glutamine methyltransferase [Pseudoalteromonas peptidolytica F12-50-A1]NLR13331.1 peptide chain release factor N(5)-glutamine methyltransferase [Pseudoalteromonas peptidolytica]GEK10787.1 release factor glutamine methyltransferase [Pseudoalteromonas peptidolytica]